MLFDKLQGEKEFHIIKWAAHDFKENEQLDKIYHIFDKRIRKIQ